MMKFNKVPGKKTLSPVRSLVFVIYFKQNGNEYIK